MGPITEEYQVCQQVELEHTSAAASPQCGHDFIIDLQWTSRCKIPKIETRKFEMRYV